MTCAPVVVMLFSLSDGHRNKVPLNTAGPIPDFFWNAPSRSPAKAQALLGGTPAAPLEPEENVLSSDDEDAEPVGRSQVWCIVIVCPYARLTPKLYDPQPPTSAIAWTCTS